MQTVLHRYLLYQPLPEYNGCYLKTSIHSNQLGDEQLQIFTTQAHYGQSHQRLACTSVIFITPCCRIFSAVDARTFQDTWRNLTNRTSPVLWMACSFLAEERKCESLLRQDCHVDCLGLWGRWAPSPRLRVMGATANFPPSSYMCTPLTTDLNLD